MKRSGFKRYGILILLLFITVVFASTRVIKRPETTVFLDESVEHGATIAEIDSGAVIISPSNDSCLVRVFNKSGDMLFEIDSTGLNFNIAKTMRLWQSGSNLYFKDPATGVKSLSDLATGTGDGAIDSTFISVLADTFFIANNTTYIIKDGSNNLVFVDSVTGSKTLAELTWGGVTLSQLSDSLDLKLNITDFLSNLYANDSYLVEATELTSILSGYTTDSELTTALSGYATDAELTSGLSAKLNSSDFLATLQANDSYLTEDTELNAALSTKLDTADFSAFLDVYDNNYLVASDISGKLNTADFLTTLQSNDGYLTEDSELLESLSYYVTSISLSSTLDGYTTDSELNSGLSSKLNTTDFVSTLQANDSYLVEETELSTTLSDYTTDSELTTTLSGYATDAELASGLSVKLNTSDFLTTLQANDDYLTEDTELSSALSSYVTSSTFSSTLSSYVTDSELSTTLSGYTTDSELTSALSDKLNTADFVSTLQANDTYLVENTELTSILSDYATGSDLTAGLNNKLDKDAFADSVSQYLTGSGGVADSTFTSAKLDTLSPLTGTEFYLGESGGFTKVESDGTIVFTGDAIVFKRFGVSTTQIIPQGGNQPGFDTSLIAWRFDDSSSEQLLLTLTLPTDYKEGTSIVPVVSWFTASAVTGAVYWQVQYKWTDVDEIMDSGFTVINTTDASSGVARTLQEASFASITGTGKEINSVLSIIISREGGQATDTMTGDARFNGLSFIYQVDTIGARTQTGK